MVEGPDAHRNPLDNAAPAGWLYDLPRLLDLYRLEYHLLHSPDALLHPLCLPDPAPRRIGVVSGSFNPLTRGHTALVEAALNDGADAVVLLLPLRAIDKEAVSRAAAFDRALVLLQWAQRYPRVGVVLSNRGLYVEQAGLLAGLYPGHEIVFVVGYDKIVQIFDPRYYTDREAALHALFARASLCVAPRQGQGPSDLAALLDRPDNRPFAGQVKPLAIPADVAELSSTVVRERVSRGEQWEHLVPEETLLFIREAQPYTTNGETDPYGLRLALIEAAANNHLHVSPSDFARLYHVACTDTPEGHTLRATLI